MQSPPRSRLVVALIVGVLSMSSAALWVRLSHAPAVTIALHRMVYATLLLAPVAWLRARDELRARTRRELALQAGAGVLLALHFATWMASLAPASSISTSVAASTTLVTLHPLLVATLTPWVLHKPFPVRALPGLLLALAGGIAIALGDAAGGTHRLPGDALALAGAATAAGYFLAGAKLRARMGLLAYVMPVYTAAAITLALLARATGAPLMVYELREHLLFLALAVGPMILGHTVFNWALGHAPAWVVSGAFLAEPVGSTLLVFVVLGERPPWTAVAGGLVVLTGLYLAAAREQSRRP